jgi:hypothetical protein
LNLPEHFVRLVHDRALIDAWQEKHRRVAPGTIPAPVRTFASPHRAGRFVRTMRAELRPEVSAYRAGSTNRLSPLRGFRAPILDHAGNLHAIARLANGLSAMECEAAAVIERRLAHDGLLATLAEVIDRLGPAQYLTNTPAALTNLATLGFPCDLLRHFRADDLENASNRPPAIVTLVARMLVEGAGLEAVRQALRRLPFEFVPSAAEIDWTEGATVEAVATERHQTDFNVKIQAPKFEAATDSGENDVGLFRVQVGGGWRDGIVPGGSIDVIVQLVEVQRDAEFLISVEYEVAGPFESMVTNSWRLRRPNHATLCVEAFPVAPWAQDNGKAGVLVAPSTPPNLATVMVVSNGLQKPATLAPRYATTGEARSTFEPGESYLMDGLRAAGHTVIHSPLLFQGGNLLVVRQPQSGERLLLLGEGEVYRNVALGLTSDQTLEAFRREFGVDRCVILPAASYHLDFDVCLRAHKNEVVAFVNDNHAAVRLILGLGLEALARHGALDAAHAQAAREDLGSGHNLELLRRLTHAIPQPVATGKFPAALSRFFVADSTDDAAGNLQTFLLALDLLESECDTNAPPAGNAERVEYLLGLRRMSQAQRKQIEQLQRLGWRIVPIPSMTELNCSINYLNGIHYRGGYIMPAFGGFYASLDRAAQAAFGQTLGADIKLTRIRSAECQRKHGGVRCAAAAYPGRFEFH